MNLFIGIYLTNLIIFLGSLLTLTNASETTQHRTKAASEKQHDLWCYRCDTMFDGDKCVNLTGNHSTLHCKCTKEQKKCQVKNISMSSSTDEITGKPKTWLVQRNCSETCEPGCIVIGERIKLHSCITCCDDNFCNDGNGTNNLKSSFKFLSVMLTLVWTCKST